MDQTHLAQIGRETHGSDFLKITGEIADGEMCSFCQDRQGEFFIPLLVDQPQELCRFLIRLRISSALTSTAAVRGRTHFSLCGKMLPQIPQQLHEVSLCRSGNLMMVLEIFIEKCGIPLTNRQKEGLNSLIIFGIAMITIGVSSSFSGCLPDLRRNMQYDQRRPEGTDPVQFPGFHCQNTSRSQNIFPILDISFRGPLQPE